MSRGDGQPGDGEVRLERDSLGELAVPKAALWGPQTQRAVQNFPISGRPLPPPFIRALGLVKATAAEVNGALGELPADVAAAVVAAAERIAAGEFLEQFPVDVFQTGSGTSSNMNANEVIARLAAQTSGLEVHPNDHVNRGQSSNDVIPTTLQLAAVLQTRRTLLPALDHLTEALDERADELADVVKTGRTHLMDAMPVSLGREVGAWRTQVAQARVRIEAALADLQRLAQGGTAVGTGVNAHPEFAGRFAEALGARTGIAFETAADKMERLACQDGAAALSGALRTLAVGLNKIANDLRWMNSGPLAGLGEIELPALQPGSSIMPGKVNPVIPEAVTMVCAQVFGQDVTIGIAAQSGSFQLNVMLPVIADNLLSAIELLGNASRVLADSAIAGFTVRQDTLDAALARNPILVTALNAVIGYDQGAAIAKAAYASGRPVIDVAAEMTTLSRAELEKLLDPRSLI